MNITNHSGLKALAMIAAATTLGACSTSYPVRAIGPDGTILNGYANAAIDSGGSFQAVGPNGVACSGHFSIMHAGQVSFPVNCNNGRTGIGTATYATPTSGAGSIRMSDGSDWKFIFGNAAR